VRVLLILVMVVSVSLAVPVFAQEDQPTPEDQAPPTGPVLQPADYSPVICDPGAPGFRYVEVRGSGFDAWARQHLVGDVIDASGVLQIHWASVWVTPQGGLTLEVNLCGDPFQKRPALGVGDYTVAVGQAGSSPIAATTISLASPPEPLAEGDQTPPAGDQAATNPNPTPTPATSTFVIPTVQSQAVATLYPVASMPAPTPTPSPRTGLGSQQQPYPMGAPGNLVDGWQLIVTGVTPDAYNGIKAAVTSSTAPAADQRDYMIRVQATYLGPGTGVFGSARLALVSGIQTSYDQIHNNCGVIPDSLAPNVVTSGTTVRGNVCFTVRASDVDSLVMLDNQASPADQVYFSPP
jgi:hypothetical protein